MPYRELSPEEADLVARAQAAVDAIVPGEGMVIQRALIDHEEAMLWFSTYVDRLEIYDHHHARSRKGVDHLLAHVLPTYIHRHRRLHAMTKPATYAGFPMETPFARMLLRHYKPREVESFLSSASWTLYDHDTPRVRPKFKLQLVEGRYRAEFSLEQGVDWRRGVLTMANRSIPETVLIGLAGRPVTDLARHPLLGEDLMIRKCATDEEGRIVVTTHPPSLSYEDLLRAA